MTWFIVVAVAVILIAAVYVCRYPAACVVTRHIDIRCRQRDALNKVMDIKGWRSWSPWLLHEPDCPLTYSDNSGVA